VYNEELDSMYSSQNTGGQLKVRPSCRLYRPAHTVYINHLYNV